MTDKNPLLVAMVKVEDQHNQQEFNPPIELGVSDEHMIQYLNTAMSQAHELDGARVIGTENGNQVVLLSVENLAYFIAVGTCVGYQLAKGGTEGD